MGDGGDADVEVDPCLAEELCDDAIDNDCDGQVDEGCEAPCVCAPGQGRVCDPPEYSQIGAQECTPDGAAWGPCREAESPRQECPDVDAWYSPALEFCLVAWRVCSQDAWDLDRDGDTEEALGSCERAPCQEPEEERCGDLFDNDFDGHVDEDCGACVCLPGSSRYSTDQSGYDSNWALQPCLDDGTWGTSRELDRIPEECNGDGWYSPESQACCVDQDWCCRDYWDFDGDGDSWESVGFCPEPLCPS